eukprot:scaffold1992_cov187-Amphora_coffeaeformis.AAC.24
MDLSWLSGLPNLEELDCSCCFSVTGDLSDLRIFRDRMTKLMLEGCDHVTGSMEDLYDFSVLRQFDLSRCNKISVEIQTIRDTDFLALMLRKSCRPRAFLNRKAYRASTEVSIIIHLIDYLFVTTFIFHLRSRTRPPFSTENTVTAGGRVGRRWKSYGGKGCCETNWLTLRPASPTRTTAST